MNTQLSFLATLSLNVGQPSSFSFEVLGLRGILDNDSLGVHERQSMIET